MSIVCVVFVSIVAFVSIVVIVKIRRKTSKYHTDIDMLVEENYHCNTCSLPESISIIMYVHVYNKQSTMPLHRAFHMTVCKQLQCMLAKIVNTACVYKQTSHLFILKLLHCNSLHIECKTDNIQSVANESYGVVRVELQDNVTCSLRGLDEPRSKN